MPDLTRDGEVFVFDLGADENRFWPGWVARMDDLLDEVEAADGPRALVTTASGKQYSSGLDLGWIGEVRDEAGDRLNEIVQGVQHVYARFLTAPFVTVAAIPGHAFAAGAMLALAHDHRIMRADRGFWCVPEVDLGMAFTPGMTALLRARLAPQVAHEAMLTGKRYGGEEAAALAIVDAAVAEDEVLPRAVELARSLAAKPAASVAAIRTAMYGDVLEALRRTDALDLPG